MIGINLTREKPYVKEDPPPVKGDTRPLEIVIPSRAGHFPTLRLLAPLQRRNSRFALKQSSLSALRCGGRVTRKISNARFRDPISKLRKGLDAATAQALPATGLFACIPLTISRNPVSNSTKACKYI